MKKTTKPKTTTPDWMSAIKMAACREIDQRRADKAKAKSKATR